MTMQEAGSKLKDKTIKLGNIQSVFYTFSNVDPTFLHFYLFFFFPLGEGTNILLVFTECKYSLLPECSMSSCAWEWPLQSSLH